MATIQVPVSFCSTFRSGPYQVRLPFGLPPLIATDPFALLGNLNVFMAALSPFLQIVGCFFKLIAVVKAIPGVVDPISGLPKFVSALGELGECFGVTIPRYTIVFIIPEFLIFIKDVLTLTIALLQWILDELNIIEGSDAQVNAWLASLDPSLKSQATCLAEQNQQKRDELDVRLNGVKSVIAIVNIMLLVALQPPIELDSGAFHPTVLSDTISVLTSIRDAIPG